MTYAYFRFERKLSTLVLLKYQNSGKYKNAGMGRTYSIQLPTGKTRLGNVSSQLFNLI